MNLYKKFQAWAQAKFNRRYEMIVAGRKRRLFDGIGGTVVEIGPGTGPNLKFFPKDINWIGIEPNVYTHPYIEKEAARLGMRNIQIKRLTAGKIPLPNNSVDAVVCTLVLCSVPDQRDALAEIYRILRPGGKLIFLEHVAAPRGTSMRRLQTLIKPAWMVIADGCRPDRETLESIKAANFTIVDSESFKILNTFVSPHIAGVARK